ncbi:GAF domain-containing sensor histidine kinase [Pedobacter cryotolerans]|uniref:histidine kinase n=1 Tax=Pedobacter cryotolerans TaxID=2571270 RepID=A0A4U1C2G7_9SPHI|nr:GAF domain-containing sensor histidine kinase [Pedobacter cryotolerans]TKB99894.1 GAF domain-containing sensor histidine kinase [Pedobacter cryotolerans]
MSSNITPIPANEMDRILNLYEFDIDYSNLESTFKDLTTLAAKICGTDISLINLIDSYTQWSISNFGLAIDQMAREDSVCQYTILEQEQFEVEDLSVDNRFKSKSYVDSPLNLRYYFGVPLRTNSGHNIGALCVLDKDLKKLSPEKIEMLKIVANEIITRLNTIKVVQDLKTKLHSEKETSKKVAHDTRGPLAGIIGISQIIKDQVEDDTKLNDIFEMVNLIHRGGRSVLDLADEILSEKRISKPITEDDFNLSILKEKITKLYTPQARLKDINFVVNINEVQKCIPFAKNKVLQIVGNLISNAMKFTNQNGDVIVNLDLREIDEKVSLNITVVDTGVGINDEMIDSILNGSKTSTNGTEGEKGYGFGLKMIKHLIDGLNGEMEITSIEGEGTRFEVMLPQY